MSKKVVKTAREQFEERLRGYGLLEEWQTSGCDKAVATKELPDGQIVVLGEYAHNSYMEWHYPSYNELREDDQFRLNCLEEFSASQDKDFVLRLVYWIAYNDGDCPLYPKDIEYITGVKPKSFKRFENIYEEVPEATIVTAREQWELDSKGAEVAQELENGSVYKVAITDGSITFFVHQAGEYFREVYPSFSELRKDADFVTRYLESVRMSHDADMEFAFKWLRGGDYTMSAASLLDIYENAQPVDHFCYHDKEEPGVDRLNFSDEIEVLRKKMVGHIIQLCEQGFMLNLEKFCREPLLSWKYGHYVLTKTFSDCWVVKDNYNEWLFCFNTDATHFITLNDLSIESLKNISEALQ